jgi:hypothetical protein
MRVHAGPSRFRPGGRAAGGRTPRCIFRHNACQALAAVGRAAYRRCPLANCGGGYPRLLAPPAVLYFRAGGLSGSISAGTCGCSGLGCPPLGPRSPLSLRLSGGPGSLVVALHRRRCPLLVFRIFPLLPYIRRASSRHLGLVGSSSLALPPLFGCLFRYIFSSFNSGVVSRLRAIETRTGVSILRMQGLVGSFVTVVGIDSFLAEGLCTAL